MWPIHTVSLLIPGPVLFSITLERHKIQSQLGPALAPAITWPRPRNSLEVVGREGLMAANTVLPTMC